MIKLEDVEHNNFQQFLNQHYFLSNNKPTLNRLALESRKGDYLNWKVTCLGEFLKITHKYYSHEIDINSYLYWKEFTEKNIIIIDRKIKEIEKAINIRIRDTRNIASWEKRTLPCGMTLREYRIKSYGLFDSELPKRCESCGSEKKLHIHHITYDYPILRENLMRLCNTCHTKLENEIRRNRKNGN